MASPGFPQRKSSGSGGMTSGGPQQILDGPPPSPMTPPNPQPGMAAGTAQPMPTFAQMSQPLTAGTPGRASTPEVTLGVYQGLQTINGMFDSMASILPDLATDFALLKDLVSSTAAKLVTNSGVSPPPHAVGANFPGGGFASGGM